MLMTSPSKVNSAHLAKDFLGIDRKCRVDKTLLAEWLQLVKDAAKVSQGDEIDLQKLIEDNEKKKETVTVVTGTIS